MTPDLEALAVAAYVFADEYPVPARPVPRAKVADAELVALAVCQAAMGINSDRSVPRAGRLPAGGLVPAPAVAVWTSPVFTDRAMSTEAAELTPWVGLQ